MTWRPWQTLTITSIRNHADQIAKHLKDIRSFQLNALEQAKDKATSIKKNVDKLISDVDAFNNMENKALGKAKALITSVKFYQDTCVRLSLDGIQFLEDNVGASEDTLNQLYEELFRFITEAEVEQKRAEQRDRMEASEIMKTSPNIRLTTWLVDV